MVRLWPGSSTNQGRPFAQIDCESEEYVRHASRFYDRPADPTSETSAVVETVYRKPREYVNIHEHNSRSVEIDRIPTAIGFHSLDSMDDGIESRYEAAAEVMERQREEQERLKRQQEEDDRKKEEEDRKKEEEERNKHQENFIKHAEQTLQTKIGESEVKTLSVRDETEGPAVEGGQTGEMQSTNDNDGDDNTSERSDDSDSCPALWRNASEEENILIDHKDYDQALAEAKRLKALNEVQQPIESKVLGEIMPKDQPGQDLDQKAVNDEIESLQLTGIKSTRSSKKKGPWNGWLGKMRSSSSKKDNITKTNKPPRTKNQHSKRSSTRQSLSTTANSTTKTTSTQNLSSTRPSNKSGGRTRAPDGAHVLNTIEGQDPLKGKMAAERTVSSIAKDPSRENYQKNGSGLFPVESITKSSRSGLSVSNSQMKTLDRSPAPDMKMVGQSSKFSKADSADWRDLHAPEHAKLHTDWTPVDPEADHMPSFGGEQTNQTHEKPFPNDSITYDSISQSRQSVETKEVAGSDANFPLMNTDQYYEEAARSDDMERADPIPSNRMDPTEGGLPSGSVSDSTQASPKDPVAVDEINPTVRRETDELSHRQSLGAEGRQEEACQEQEEGFTSWLASQMIHLGKVAPLNLFDLTGHSIPPSKEMNVPQLGGPQNIDRTDISGEPQLDTGFESHASTSHQDIDQLNSRSDTLKQDSGSPRQSADIVEGKQGTQEPYGPNDVIQNNGFVSKRVQEFSGRGSGVGNILDSRDAVREGMSSNKETRPANIDSKPRRGPLIYPQSREVVTVSSIEIPAIDTSRLDANAEDEYSVSVLGLDRAHKRQGIDTQSGSHSKDKMDSALVQNDHLEDRDTAKGDKESRDDHGTSASQPQARKVVSTKSAVSKSSLAGSISSKSRSSQKQISSSKKNDPPTAKTGLSHEGGDTTTSSTRRSRSNQRSKSRSKSQSARSRSRSRHRARKAAAAASTGTASSSRSKVSSTERTKSRNGKQNLSNTSSSLGKKKAKDSESKSKSKESAKSSSTEMKNPKKTPSSGSKISKAKHLKIKNSKARPSKFVETFLRRGGGGDL